MSKTIARIVWGTTGALAVCALANQAHAAEHQPYEPGFPPEGNLLEIGVFGGLLAPSKHHNLRNETLPQQEYELGPETGARLGYYPASWLGLEGETMVAYSKVKGTETSGTFHATRAQIVLQAPTPYLSPFLVGGFGQFGASSRAMGSDSDGAWHFGLGAKIPFTHLVSMRVDLRDVLTANETHDGQAHSFEANIGLSAVIERSRKAPPPPPSDLDHDGFVDTVDKCPSEAGPVHGCPADTDADGVLDNDDYCPREAGPAPQGCPIIDLDPDKDGVPLPCDACPEVAGVKPDGCPIRDTDNDGIFDDKDKCPKDPETKNGFADDDGCPDKIPDAVKKFSGVVEGIYFDKAKATIRANSTKVLENAAKVLNEYPSISLEISGHTSSEGEPGVNQKLSQERADSVKQWLVDHGVAPERMKTRGAGADEPIASEKTNAGKEKNRRIEFKVQQ